MIARHSSLVVVVFLVTVLISPRYVWCTHFNSSSAVHWQPDRQVWADSGSASARTSFASSSANLDSGLADDSPAASSSFSITPSVSYQFHTNDHEHLDKIVLAHHNSVRNSFSSGISPADNVVASGYVRDDAGIRAGNFPSAIPNNKPASGLSTFHQQQHQQQQQESMPDAQRIGGDWQSKQQQYAQPLWQYHHPQQQQQQHHQPGPQAIPDRAYPLQSLRTAPAQVGKLQQQEGNANLNAQSRLTYPSPGNFSTQGQRAPTVQFGARKESPSGSPIVYSRPLKEETHQGQFKRVEPTTRTVAGKIAAPDAATSTFDKQTGSVVGVEATRSSPPPSPSKKKKKSGNRKILTSRADSYANDEEDEEEEDDEPDNSIQNQQPYYYPYRQYEAVQEEAADDQENDAEEGEDGENSYYLPPDGTNPEIRDFGFPAGPGLGGPIGPLPGPPPPLKGTVDYILIPLILIGLAGPIFVVLYVILGGFEYKLAPIARSLKDHSINYQPYLDSITSSVGRALDKYECYEYATCRFRGVYNKSLSSDTRSGIEEGLNAVTPKEYLPTLTKLFSTLKRADRTEKCVKYQCSDIVDYFL